MTQRKITLRLGFPGITDKRYKLYREELTRAEKLTKAAGSRKARVEVASR